jgi:hypothetical protein
MCRLMLLKAVVPHYQYRTGIALAIVTLIIIISFHNFYKFLGFYSVKAFAVALRRS